MENEYNIKPKLKSLNEFIKSWSFWKPVIAILVGGLAGLTYYYFIGIESGQGSPYMSVIWGGLLGLFVVNSPCSRGRC